MKEECDERDEGRMAARAVVGAGMEGVHVRRIGRWEEREGKGMVGRVRVGEAKRRRGGMESGWVGEPKKRWSMVEVDEPDK